MWYRGGYPEYVSAAEKKKNAENAAKKLIREGKQISPVRIEGQKIAKSFWGKAWCDHLQSFSDYEYRLPRGRSYVRHGAVLDLQINPGQVTALVQGSSIYNIAIDITALSKEKWKAIREKCTSEIGSLIELLQGKFSTGVMKTVADQSQGLFPAPKEIKLSCSCPDWADMCKHIAAALYGVGARLDHQPELLFTLRRVDPLELIGSATLSQQSQRSTKKSAMDNQDLSALFGIDLDEAPKAETNNSTTAHRKKPGTPSASPATPKVSAKKASTTRKKASPPPPSTHVKPAPPKPTSSTATRSKPTARKSVKKTTKTAMAKTTSVKRPRAEKITPSVALSSQVNRSTGKLKRIVKQISKAKSKK